MDHPVTLRITLMGEFQVFFGEKRVQHFQTIKTQALLAYMVMEHSQNHRKDALADLFWGQMPTPDALKNLRLTLHRLKSALLSTQPAQTAAQIYLSDHHRVQFAPGLPIWVDAQELIQRLEACFSHNHSEISLCGDCAKQMSEVVDLYRGDFLNSLQVSDSIEFEEWAAIYREKTLRLAIDALSALGKFHLHEAGTALIPVERQSHLEKALAYARRALEKEAWNEPAHQTIIEALSRLGKTSEAVAQYRACCRVLAKEFNLEPGLATTQIYQEAIHPLVTYPVQQIRGNLIPAATPFIGREPQIEKLEKLVHLYRWVTLVGEGGIGKTRLALHVAGGMAEQFNGGVWLVPLENHLPAGQTKISLHHQLTQALLSHIPILSGSEILTSARIISQIGMARMLVVFDGFEDFSDGADYILDLLANAPNLHVLVTTRQMIYFQTGYIMRVEGFPCPSAPVDTQTMLSPGVTLFLESSDRCGCSIPKTPENLSHIAHICRLLDGIPLAIELAAPWTLRLPLEKIAEYLETDLSILSSRYYDLPQRHSSMQAVFESSWKLLSPQAQVVLSMCADFPGEFSLHDVAGKIYQAEIDGLVAKSLLVQVSAGRYRLHQILRLFIKGQKCLLPIGT